MRQICNSKECTGCSACSNICPKQCIQMEQDEYGFYYPRIDESECIDCHLCERTCPANNAPQLHMPSTAYAAINQNQYDYETATSGGMATMLTRCILEQNGVVYGACLEPSCSVRHVRIDTAEDVDRIKGSKYVQSHIGDVFSLVKKDLAAERKVLFIGTPCQVAGVRKFVGDGWENLYLCDIICHGVPSARYLKDHLGGLVDIGQIKNISFREKAGYYLCANGDKGKLYRKRNFRDVYCLGFLKGLLCRECCYSCRYATDKRTGDLTLGDFWGFDNSKGEFPAAHNHGLSCVLVNTEKGKVFFRSCMDRMTYMERTVAEAVAGNKQLRKPSVKHKNYERFRADYQKYGFKKAAKKALYKERIIYGLLDFLGR